MSTRTSNQASICLLIVELAFGVAAITVDVRAPHACTKLHHGFRSCIPYSTVFPARNIPDQNTPSRRLLPDAQTGLVKAPPNLELALATPHAHAPARSITKSTMMA